MAARAFETLRRIEAQARAAAAPLPHEELAEQSWHGLGFQLAGVRFVAPLGDASEILTLPRTTRLPVVRPSVLGVANVRGRLLPIHDLHRFFDLTPTTPRAEWRVLVVEDGDFLAGLLVEQALGMQHFSLDSYAEGAPREMDAVLPFVRGSYRQSGRVWYVFAIKRLIRDTRFLDVAAGN